MKSTLNFQSETNLYRRVLGNPNPVKLGKYFDFLKNYYRFVNGGHQRVQNGLSALTLDKIAKELKMSERNFRRTLCIKRNLTDSMKERLEKKEYNVYN